MFHAELGKSTFDIWEEEQREKRITAYRRKSALTNVARVLRALQEQKAAEETAEVNEGYDHRGIIPPYIRRARQAAEAASQQALEAATNSTPESRIADKLITPEIGTTEWKIGGNNE